MIGIPVIAVRGSLGSDDDPRCRFDDFLFVVIKVCFNLESRSRFSSSREGVRVNPVPR
jgi:hypothetical protein